MENTENLLIYRIAEWNENSVQSWCINLKTKLVHYVWHTENERYINSNYALLRLVDLGTGKASETTLIDLERHGRLCDRDSFLKTLEKSLTVRDKLNALIENVKSHAIPTPAEQ